MYKEITSASLKQVAYQLALIRRMRKMSQVCLAKEMGISQTAMSNIERGITPLKLEELQKACEILGVKIVLTDEVRESEFVGISLDDIISFFREKGLVMEIKSTK